MDNPWTRHQVLVKEPIILVELCNVLHRTVLTRDSPLIQSAALEVLQLVLICANEKLDFCKRKKQSEMGIPANKQLAKSSPEYSQLPLLGEGGDNGKIDPANSVVFAALEVCFCVMVR